MSRQDRAYFLGEPAHLDPAARIELRRYALYWRALLLGLILFVEGGLISTGLFVFFEVRYGKYISTSDFDKVPVGGVLIGLLVVAFLIGLPLAFIMTGKVRKIDSSPFLNDVFADVKNTAARSYLEERLNCVRLPEGVAHSKEPGIRGTVREIYNVEFIRRFFHLRNGAWMVSLLLVLALIGYAVVIAFTGTVTYRYVTALRAQRQQTLNGLKEHLVVKNADEDYSSIYVGYPLADGNSSDVWTYLELDDEGKIRIENTWYTLYYDVRLESGEKPDMEAIRKEFVTLQEHLQLCSDMCNVDWPFRVPVIFSSDLERVFTEGSSCELLSDEGKYGIRNFDDTQIVQVDDLYFYVYTYYSLQELDGYDYHNIHYCVDCYAPTTREAYETFVETGEAPKYQYEYDFNYD